MTQERQRGGLPLEVAIVWALFAFVSIEVFVTYSRLPAEQLYHVSGSGIEGGLSRALVFVNFPVALAAIAILVMLYERVSHRILVVVAALLSAVVVWPGVVRESNLDARLVNALPALGVLLALLLTFEVARRSGISRRPWRGADWVRLVLSVVLLFLAIPWLAADLGFYSNGIPLVGGLFRSGEYLPKRPGLPTFAPAVHHGQHHGIEGVLLVLSVLLLSRRLGDVRARGLRNSLAAYLALMFCYGIGNIANDFWIEQVVKRGWTSWEIPNVLQPGVTIAWSLIVIAAVVLWALWARLVDWSGDEQSALRAQPHRVSARR
jgi:hypothetical protein